MRKMLASAATLALVITGLVASGPTASAQPTDYITMPDGVQIAASVGVPEACKIRKCPTIFEMSGYDGGGADTQDRGTIAGQLKLGTLEDDSRQLTRWFDDNYTGQEYVVVHTSVRGTGCSGGEFDLFDYQGALDGKYIIDNWIPQQSWSNGDVGLIGHSYGGLTGFLIASTQPEHLRVASLSGLIDDLYRGITYPGGVADMGFPVLWTLGIRPAYDVGGGLAPGLARPVIDDGKAPEGCPKSASTKGRTVINDPVVHGLTSDFDSDWYRVRSMMTWASKINVPTMIDGAYQDEQTGPRGPAHLYEALNVEKRLLLTNGDHNTAGLYADDHRAPAGQDPKPTNVSQERLDWLNHYLYSVPFESGLAAAAGHPVDQTHPVRVFLESRSKGKPNGIIDSTTFPLKETQWTRNYLTAGGGISSTAPTESSSSYASVSSRDGWFRVVPNQLNSNRLTQENGPDQLRFTSTPQATDQTFVGPVVASLDMSATSNDNEVFVQLFDISPDGTRAELQRGLLKVSGRGVMPSQSDCVDPTTNSKVSCESDGALMYRAFRSHTHADLINPGQRYVFDVEVWPIGHVLRAGHSLQVSVRRPPLLDNYYSYVPKAPPGVNTLYFGPNTFVTLPMIDLNSVTTVKPLGAPVPTCQQDSVRCITPSQQAGW